METFHIVPVTAKAGWWFAPVLALALAVIIALPLILGTSFHAMRHARFELSSSGLHLHGEWLYRRHVPLEHLRGGAARVVNLNDEPAFAPARRTVGTALPGYGAGWFRLQNGEKALVYLTARDRVVLVPTTDGYVILLSVTEPERMVAALAHLAPRS